MPIRVLLIDTDENFCQNLSQRLLMEKYKVLVTADVAEAKKIVQREKIDVVLLGLKGLRQRGLALLANIKKMRPATEVILMLPDGHLALSIEGMRLGAFDDLLMPFDIETLLSRITAAYHHGQAQKRIRRGPLDKQHNRVLDYAKGGRCGLDQLRRGEGASPGPGDSEEKEG
ncbi:response regulator [Desulfoferrobacter suflitae]|uniref:response regulator n=1 Tax=Desulfoferrobacter suflitae TaxID=2865782 RepID=UPI002164EC61|nr:response regulator [Desulfoferrobacter suflitae]MCK8601592.1 response regulator [Desulfoferrobacter suflitae]